MVFKPKLYTNRYSFTKKSRTVTGQIGHWPPHAMYACLWAARSPWYNQRIINIVRGVFTPLIFSTTGMIGGECQLFLKTLANMIAQRNKDIPYSIIINTIHCKLSFCRLRWNITCLRCSRSSHQEHKKVNFLAECRLQAPWY